MMPRETMREYFRACRFESWISWVFCFGLGSVMLSIPTIERFLLTLFAFAFATSSVFVLNQYFDRQADKANNLKWNLPIASERISPRNSLIFSIILGFSCLALAYVTDVNLLPLFLAYLILWTAYSAPFPNLKGVPILDFLVSALGAGLLPFCIGVGASQGFAIEASGLVLMTVPLMLFHAGAHIVQTVGDYEPDKNAGISTFAVKYGRRMAIMISGTFFALTFATPLFYLFIGLIKPIHLLPALFLLPLSIPIASRFRELYERPSEAKVLALQAMAKNVGIYALVAIWSYVLIIKSMAL